MNAPFTDYVGPTEQELLSIEFLDKLAGRLGNPSDIQTQAGLKLMDAIIGVWQKHFPQEAKDWIHDRKMDLDYEKPVSELIKDTSAGYNPAGYPRQLYNMIKVMFPNLKLQNRAVFNKLIDLYPKLFKTSNYV